MVVVIVVISARANIPSSVSTHTHTPTPTHTHTHPHPGRAPDPRHLPCAAPVHDLEPDAVCADIRRAWRILRPRADAAGGAEPGRQEGPVL